MKRPGMSYKFVVFLLIIFSIISMFSNAISMPELRTTTSRSSSRIWGEDKILGGIDSPNLVREQEGAYVISDGNQYLYCVWQDNRAGDWNIYFTKSANGGINWQNNMSICNTTSSEGNQRNPVLTIDPNNNEALFLVWQDERNDDGDI